MELAFQAVPVSTIQALEGESPLWDESIGLRWLDTIGSQMFTLNGNGETTSLPLSTRATAIALGLGRRLLAITSSGFGWLDPGTGAIEQRVVALSDETVSMNDGVVDARGRCWAGSAGKDRPCRSQKGVLFRLKDSVATVMLESLGLSNGLDWSPEGDVLYHVDSASGHLYARPYDARLEQLGEGRIVCSVPGSVGLLDGLVVDAQANVWVAVCGAGQVWRLDPGSGMRTAVISVPTQWVTSCAFGGEDLSTMYITTARYDDAPQSGLLYAANLPVRGRQPNRFRGYL